MTPFLDTYTPPCKRGTPARAFFHDSVLHKRAPFFGKLSQFKRAPSSHPF